MDFLKHEIRQYFFREYPGIYTKVVDLPPAKYNVGVSVKNSLISSGCIINGSVEDSVIFKSVSFRKAINSLKRFMEIIKTPDEKIIMKDITGETEIDYHLKNAILDKCKLIKKMNIRNS